MKLEPEKYRSKDPSRPLIVVRKVTRRDVSKILRNLEMVAREQIYIGTEKVTPRHRKGTLEHVKDRKCLTIVAEVKGEIVGSLSLWTSGLKKMGHIRELGMLIIDGYREMGIGRALIDYALKWARKQKGVEKITLGVFSTNKRAFHLYKKFGFKEEGVLKRQHILKGKYADEIRMAVFL